MSITFACNTCHKEIKVPAGTEGRQTRCPFCQAVQPIPGEIAAAASNQPAGTFSEQSQSPSRLRDEDAENPFASPNTRPTDSVGGAAAPEKLRQQLLIVAIVQLIFVILGLLVAGGQTVFWSVMAVSDNEPALVVMAGVYGVLALLHIPAIAGLIAACRRSSFVWAWIGLVMSVLPVSNCCSCAVVPIGIGIWGMIVLADPQARSLFSK